MGKDFAFIPQYPDFRLDSSDEVVWPEGEGLYRCSDYASTFRGCHRGSRGTSEPSLTLVSVLRDR